MNDDAIIEGIDWTKDAGRVPAIVQDWRSGEVLMLGYMTREAIVATCRSGMVTFFSRSRQRLWTKGETSGNVLHFKSLHVDCDADTVLVRAEPSGPVCHTGAATCFANAPPLPMAFLGRLDGIVEQRSRVRPTGSYTTGLFESGTRLLAQKVGEEAVETALAAVAQGDEALLGEAADLIFHLIVMLRARKLDLGQVTAVLAHRHRSSPETAARTDPDPDPGIAGVVSCPEW